MRIRSTKPEFWRSSTMAQFDMEERLILKALESYVDDNGVGRDSVVIFCADAFPHDLAKSSEIVAKVSRALDRFSEADIIVRYTVAGEPLLYVRHWKRWQYIDKPKAGRYPRPDGTMNYRQTVDETIGADQAVDVMPDRETYVEPPETFAKTSRKPPEKDPQIQSGEQGNRGTVRAKARTTRANQQRRQPTFTEQLRGTPDPTPNAPPEDTATRPTASTAAADLVRAAFPLGRYPDPVLADLRIRVSALLNEGTDPSLITEALRLWDERDGGPGLLPHLLADAAKARRPKPAANGKPTAYETKTAHNAAVYAALGTAADDQPKAITP